MSQCIGPNIIQLIISLGFVHNFSSPTCTSRMRCPFQSAEGMPAHPSAVSITNFERAALGDPNSITLRLFRAIALMKLSTPDALTELSKTSPPFGKEWDTEPLPKGWLDPADEVILTNQTAAKPWELVSPGMCSVQTVVPAVDLLHIIQVPQDGHSPTDACRRRSCS